MAEAPGIRVSELKEVEHGPDTIAIGTERPERVVVAIEQSFHSGQTHELAEDVEQVFAVADPGVGVCAIPEPLPLLCGLSASIGTGEIDIAE